VKAGNQDKAIEVYRKLITFDPASQDRRIRIPVYHYGWPGSMKRKA
jgi:hypothetical protein